MGFSAKAKALLSRGMFPRELPPIFTTTQLGAASPALATALKNKKREPTKPERFSLPKAKLGRRTSFVVNPVAYLDLAISIGDNWKEIRRALKSKFSGAPPSFFGKERALKEINFKSIRERNIVEGSGHSFILLSDFSRFFPTVYSHSIPWALHTKAVSKSKKYDDTLLGNVLDRNVRYLQDNQTAGIPIGPDASYIVAEIVACAIDRDLCGDGEAAISGLRYVDDYTLFSSTRAEAEKSLSRLAQSAAKYQIELNPDKTAILSISDEAKEAWVFAFGSFKLGDSKQWQRDSLAKLTELAISLHARNSDNAVGKYAIKIIASKPIDPGNVDFAIACCLRLTSISPSAVPEVIAFILTYENLGYSIDRAPLKRYIENAISRGTPVGNDMEVAWALWLALKLKIKLAKTSRVVLEKTASSLVALLGKTLSETGMLSAKFAPEIASSKPTVGDFVQDRWLLYYEGSRRKWFGWTAAELSKSYLAEVHKADVNFLDLAATTSPSIKSLLKLKGKGAGKSPSAQEQFNALLKGYSVKSSIADYGVSKQTEEGEKEDF